MEPWGPLAGKDTSTAFARACRPVILELKQSRSLCAMAQNELTIQIPKEHWPKNVLRMLTPCLRKLGDSHGHIIIAAQPARGALLLKGPSEKIDAAKPGLRALIEEHFPEAEMPAELRQEAEQAQEEVEEAAQTDAYGGEPLDVEALGL
ncbi:hypothetical protein AK812_SmicGene19609 [Symbiodinium microadriaticum]|uniref:K Homology domain-containing protein n=1 Tax=Symbiodinium microadriaticum TaxID=2951 RepID=A0A1Q9DS26_SYMMI|nr:hypothetical protein AK812_SmicGene19609 [Symbiodinium microadriaticum]